jgi:outer membrane protein assembly factor BamB
VYTSVVIGDGVGVAMSGFHGPAMGFKLGGAGNITESNRLWLTKERQPQRIGTGIFVGKLLYMVNENATVQCLDVETGKDLWPATTRLPQGTIWGSPVLVDGRFYVTNQNGNTIVFKPGAETFELLAENKLDERSNSTPAVSNGQIFVRTYKALYCIEDPAQQN